MTPSRLRAIRESMGLTQEALSAHLGLTRDAIVKMEAGKRPIEQRTKLGLAAIQAKLEPME